MLEVLVEAMIKTSVQKETQLHEKGFMGQSQGALVTKCQAPKKI